MNISKTLHVTKRAEWRKWLRRHYKSEKEIWLVYYKKATGRPRIQYNDAVEEALCFGWIDSIVKPLDRARTVQRFSPRKPKAKYSQANIERLRALVTGKKVIREVREQLKDVLKEKFVVAPDILKTLKADRQVWKNFQKFSASYRRIRIAYIEGARKRPAEFRKRLKNFIRMTGKNKMIGYGGIEKHY